MVVYPGVEIAPRDPKKGKDDEKAAAGEAVDPDRLLPGEDPESSELEDSAHWIAVYSELLLFKERLLDTAGQGLSNMTEAESRQEAANTDLMLLSAERTRLQRRLEFWKQRLRAETC